MADAWYSGDQAKVISVYGGPGSTATTSDSLWFRFWSHRQIGRQRIHVPTASDVAATAADLLCSDEPRLVIPAAQVERSAERQPTG